MNINYDEHIANVKEGEQRDIVMGNARQQTDSKQSATVVGGTQKGSIIDFGSGQPRKVEQPVAKKVKSLLDDDDDLIGGSKQEQPANIVTPPVVQPPQQNFAKNSDPFDILGLDIGGSSNPIQPTPPPQNTGGDIFGFSFTNPQPVVNTQPPINFNQNQGFSQNGGMGNLFDGGLLGNTQPKQSPPPVVNNSLGFDFLGTGSSSGSIPVSQPQSQPQPRPQFSFNQPQTNQFVQQQQQQNSFKFKAYETPHVEVWMEGKQEGEGNTRITAHFNNKTSSYVEQLSFQTAVMKYLKIVIQPMSGNSLPPSSKAAVSQILIVNNSAVGQKPIVMKIKISYTINGQKEYYE